MNAPPVSDDLWEDDDRPTPPRRSAKDPNADRDARLRDAGIDPRDRGLADTRETLRKIALYQKGVLWCVLLNVAAYGLVVAVTVSADENPPPGVSPHQALLLAGVALILVVSLASLVFVFLLASQLYGWVLGLVAALLTPVSCLGLLVLLAVSQGATTRLNKSGVRVGFMGADMSTL